MGKVEKTLNRDLDELSRKIDTGVCVNCPLTKKRHEWTQEFEGGKCIVKVFEKYADTQEGCHYSMTVVLFETGGEVKLWAATSGGSNALFFIPYDTGEGALSGALDITLRTLDDMIM